MLTKEALLDYLEEIGEEGATAWAVAEVYRRRPKLRETTRLLACAQMGLLKLVRQGLATRAILHEPGSGRRGANRWSYRYCITPRGRARLAYWRGK